MKKIVIALCLVSAFAPALHADDAKKDGKQMTDAQKKVFNDILTKYDSNKDGRLSKEESGKMTAEDKEKMQKSGFGARKKS